MRINKTLNFKSKGALIPLIVTMTLAVLGFSEVAAAKIKEGSPFPSMALPKLGAKGTIDLAKLKGKVVVVDFWASWCEPCKLELPALDALYKKHRAKGLVIIGVNMDETPAEARTFLKERPVQFPHVYDGEKKALADKLELDKMPTSFILDRSGKIVVRHEAFRPGDEKKIETTILKLLKKK